MEDETYCLSCGNPRRLTWPKDQPMCCSLRCCAHTYLQYVEQYGYWDGAYCTKCGDSLDSCVCDGGKNEEYRGADDE